MNLSNKRILVTGGAVRIGKSIVEALQARGAEVVIHCNRSVGEAQSLSDQTIQADLSDPESCSALIAECNERFGRLDGLINNASVFSRDSLAASSQAAIESEFQINLFAPMVLIREFAAQAEQGHVVNLLDRRIQCHDTNCVPYSLTKYGLAELTRLAALELAPRIQVNGVAPGPVLPPPESPDPVLYREKAGSIPLDRLPSPADIAESVLFLMQSTAITGQVIYVDGGQHLLGNGV